MLGSAKGRQEESQGRGGGGSHSASLGLRTVCPPTSPEAGSFFLVISVSPVLRTLSGLSPSASQSFGLHHNHVTLPCWFTITQHITP